MDDTATALKNLVTQAAPGTKSKPIYVIAADTSELPASAIAWLGANDQKLTDEFVSLLPATSIKDGDIAGAVLGIAPEANPFAAGKLARQLPDGHWYFKTIPDGVDAEQLLLGYLLGSYAFDRYKSRNSSDVILHIPQGVDLELVLRKAKGVHVVRDMVNTPANDMGPNAIEAAARAVARAHKATVKVITGDDLLAKNFPLIHAVGRAAAEQPRLVDIKWGRRGAPKLTLVGKGVAYDTGGLNIKPGNSMRNMKKDMGGAAHMIALADMVMAAKLDVRLRLLIPTVENSISSGAFRPGDVYPSRKDITVEIGNTDAEGRLILADALALADEETPELLIDFATLTGAARVALGPDVAPFFTDDDTLAAELGDASTLELDPIWRMPLWKDYARNLSSTVADCCNISSDSLGGAITAALFLQKFVTRARSWVHFDVFAWSTASKPHASVGGEAQGLRALFRVLERRYPPKASSKA
ncbi:MAG: leucyl aminopeptidase family protein [Pseudomonadota bacterium]